MLHLIFIFKSKVNLTLGFHGNSAINNRPARQEVSRRHSVDPWVRKLSLRRKWQPPPVFLPGNPMDRRASNMTE